MKRYAPIIVLLLFVFTGCASIETARKTKNSISPISYGLLDAKSGEERFEVLLKAHKEALQQGLVVDYSNLDTINVTIPKGA